MVENPMGEALDDTLHLPRPGARLRVAPIGLGSWTGRWRHFFLLIFQVLGNLLPVYCLLSLRLIMNFIKNSSLFLLAQHL